MIRLLLFSIVRNPLLELFNANERARASHTVTVPLASYSCQLQVRSLGAEGQGPPIWRLVRKGKRVESDREAARPAPVLVAGSGALLRLALPLFVLLLPQPLPVKAL